MSGRNKETRIFACDFETTVYDGQKNTEVWAAASVELGREKVEIQHSIQEMLEYFASLKSNVTLYFHNLKFDGSFWLDFLMNDKRFSQAYTRISDISGYFHETKKLQNNTFKYSISDKGQWYSITIKYKKHLIEIRDSLKLLPFSVAEIGKAFKTKHQKLEMEYEGYRYAGCEITEKEREYIANDVLVVKEALEMMFIQGHDKMTIGSCCLSEYKEILKTSLKCELTYKEMFPNIYNIGIEGYGKQTAGEYIRDSYKGGWCYLVKGKEDRIYYNGKTADVNSLYPSVMHSESGNYYPIGEPHFFKGEIPPIALEPEKYYFVRIKTRFYLKDGMLPFIQIKNNALYKGTECLESSDIYNPKDGQYYTHINGKDTRVTLTLTMTDFELIKKHYHLVDFELLDGCWFYAKKGIFDEYIDKWAEVKKKSKGAMRTLAKLFLNNLYGKMASSTESSFKLAYIKEDGSIGFYFIEENEKEPGYIPVGSAITSYARAFTITAAQANYHGVDAPGFIYADTDSIHCDLQELVGIKIHPSNFCCWKVEGGWDKAVFTRQKTYIEHVTHEDEEKVEPHHVIKCAGMPVRCKDLFALSMSGTAKRSGYISSREGEHKEWTKEEYDFLFTTTGKRRIRDYSDFKIGLKVPGKLIPKRIPGGIILVNTTYEMH